MKYVRRRLGRRVFSYAANVLLVLPLGGCAALQEPGPSLALESLREPGQRIADAATLAGAALAKRLSFAVARTVSRRPAALDLPNVYDRALPAAAAGLVPSPTGFSARLAASNHQLALSAPAIAAAYRYHANAAQWAGDDRTAVNVLKKLLALDAANSAGWLRLARLQAQLRDETAELASLGLALQYNPANDAARAERGELLLRLGQHSAALADFATYLSRHAGAIDVLRMRVEAARDAQDHQATLAAIDAYLAVAHEDVAMLRLRGDELEAEGDENGAIDAWKAYAERRPADDADVLKQIAYASERRQDLSTAVWALTQYTRERPSDDRMKLALAYDQARSGHSDLAVAAFTLLQKSPDETVANQAAAELRARLGGALHSSRVAYATVQYDSRFANTVFGVDAYALAPARRLQPYAVIHSWDDTRSSDRAQEPLIYNDDGEVFGGGVRYNIGTRAGSYFFAEGGEQISLIGRGTSPEFRYGFASWSERGSAAGGHTSYGFSVASYSRYGANVIGYSNILHDFPLTSGFRGVVGTNFALDSHREYWNNVAEVEVGVKVGSPRFSVTLAGVDGVYLPRGAAVPFHRSYTTFRPSITWSPHL